VDRQLTGNRFNPVISLKGNLMKTRVKSISAAVMLVMASANAMAQTASAPAASAVKTMMPQLLSELAKYQSAETTVSKHISTFDNLDFDVFTHQKWDRLHESHSKDVVVHWPDGRQTKGIDVHIADLKAMFVYAPDTRIETHPVKFGQGEWTAVIGMMEGTFTQPMPVGDGKTIAPTGKKYKLSMATVSHWKDGTMDEEYLFWDNATFMKQIGLGN
jgi:predicted ester cyclase